jgi:hypothetical protein
MRDLHKLLSVLLAQLHALFPEGILANAFFHYHIDNATAGRMQVMHDAAIALQRIFRRNALSQNKPA